MSATIDYGMLLKSTNENVGSTVNTQKSTGGVQNRTISLSWESVATTTAGSGVAFTALTNLLEGSSCTPAALQ